MRISEVRDFRSDAKAGRRRSHFPSFLTGSFPQSINVTGIPTGESWPSPTIPFAWFPGLVPKKHYAPDEPEGIGRRKVFLPSLPNIIRFPFAAILTSEVWPTPIVAGPVTVVAIASGESWPTPTIDAQQTISFAAVAITTGESWPSPHVFIAQQITLAAAIPTGEHWGTPTISGGVQFLSVFNSIPSGEHWPSPTISGGRQGTFIFVGGVEMSQYLARDTVNGLVVQSQTLGRWHANFDLVDPLGSLNPQLGQTVLITDFGLRIFAGCIQNVVWDRYLGAKGPTPATRWHITCTDKSSICDHRIVTGKTYTAIEPFTGLPVSVASVIVDIVNNFLNGEGILPYGVPIDGTLGNLDSDLTFNFSTVTAAFDQIALLSGTVWWITVDGILNFSSLANLPVAPFSLSEISDNFRGSQSGSQNTGGGLTTTRTTTNYYNKLYAVSNLNILPGSGSGGGSGAGGGQTETFTFTVGQPGVRSAINPITNLLYAQAILTSVGIGNVISMTVNGHAQTVFNIAEFSGQTSSGPNDYLWSFFQGSNAVAWIDGPVPVGATVVITYVPFTTLSASLAQYGQAVTPVDPSGNPLGTCGSGIYEGVIQVKDISSQADLNAIALAELDRIGGIPTIVDFQTDFPGLAPGQLITVNVPLSGIPIAQALATQLLITSVTGTHKGGKMPGGSSFFWDVSATSILDPGNYVKWYERLIGRTNNPLPVLQRESATFILGTGSTLSGGVSVTNPFPVQATGLVYEIQVGAGTPPVDQDLVLTITDNNVAVATVRLPAGATPNVFLITAVPKSNQIYFYAHDSLNCNAVYQVTGPNPVKASNVTLKITWTM